MSDLIQIQPFAIKDDSPITCQIAAVPDDELPVIECFYGIEGEGSDIGEPRILLRVGGCRVSCLNCDTPNSWGLKSSQMMKVADVIDMVTAMVTENKVHTVAITGGEPMHYRKQIQQIADKLRDHHIRLWLETSGYVLDTDTFDYFDFISFDVKTPCTGSAVFTDDAIAKMKEFFAHNTIITGQIKFVVDSERDFDWIEANFEKWLKNGVPVLNYAGQRQPVILTPAAGRTATPQQVRERMTAAMDYFKGYYVRIIAQQHALLGMR